MDKDDSRLLWRCRRGARELDSLLVPYCLARVQLMDYAEKSNLEQLLDHQDADLLDWFLGRKDPHNIAITQTIDRIIGFSSRNR